MDNHFTAAIAMYFADNPPLQSVIFTHSASHPDQPILIHKYNSHARRPLATDAQQSLLRHAAAALAAMPNLRHGDKLRIWRDGDGYAYQFELSQPVIPHADDYAVNLPF